MLEQIRNKIKEQYEQIYNDPNSDDDHKDFIEQAAEIFDNEEAISLLSTPQIIATVSLLGYSIPESKEIALKIEEEVNRKYHYVNLEGFKS